MKISLSKERNSLAKQWQFTLWRVNFPLSWVSCTLFRVIPSTNEFFTLLNLESKPVQIYRSKNMLSTVDSKNNIIIQAEELRHCETQLLVTGPHKCLLMGLLVCCKYACVMRAFGGVFRVYYAIHDGPVTSTCVSHCRSTSGWIGVLILTLYEYISVREDNLGWTIEEGRNR